MLTPTDVHFLVGLLTQIARPDGVELELGSMVFDVGAEEERDVDITVRVVGQDGTISTYEGVEVKHHTRPLDVIQVEQLCTKLRDMPAITARGIVSASGYTEPAIKKARYHGVALYSLIEWTEPVGLASIIVTPHIAFVESGYRWVNAPHVTFNPNLELPEHVAQQLTEDTPVFDSGGSPLGDALTGRGFAERLASHAPPMAKQQGNMPDLNIGEMRSVDFNIKLEDPPFVLAGSNKIFLTEARVSGVIEYVRKVVPPIRKILVMHEDQQPIVACAVFELSEGNLGGFSFDTNRQIRYINIPVADRLLKKIYRRRLT